MRNLLSISDLTKDEIDNLICEADNIIQNPELYSDCMKNKILATLFFEPSTRTRLSFESAMYGLGGNVIGFSDSSTSSVTKGESLTDTIQIVQSYSDIIAIRNSFEGSALAASIKSTVPIINAGDGGHYHPTQTLTDIFTIKKEVGRLNNLNIGLCGDLKYGRTVHSLFSAMAEYQNIHFTLISPKELKMPEYILSANHNKNLTYEISDNFYDSIKKLDVLYMTRIQKERFSDINEYEKLKDSFILTPAQLKDAKHSLIIMHPLPRVNEISEQIDNDSRAVYFKQAFYGRYIRMALIKFLIESKSFNPAKVNFNYIKTDKSCLNAKCISNFQKSLPKFALYDELSQHERCAYCEHTLE